MHTICYLIFVWCFESDNWDFQTLAEDELFCSLSDDSTKSPALILLLMVVFRFCVPLRFAVSVKVISAWVLSLFRNVPTSRNIFFWNVINSRKRLRLGLFIYAQTGKIVIDDLHSSQLEMPRDHFLLTVWMSWLISMDREPSIERRGPGCFNSWSRKDLEVLFEKRECAVLREFISDNLHIIGFLSLQPFCV